MAATLSANFMAATLFLTRAHGFSVDAVIVQSFTIDAVIA